LTITQKKTYTAFHNNTIIIQKIVSENRAY